MMCEIQIARLNDINTNHMFTCHILAVIFSPHTVVNFITLPHSLGDKFPTYTKWYIIRQHMTQYIWYHRSRPRDHSGYGLSQWVEVLSFNTFTEMKMSFWCNFCHWLHWKLSKWQLSVHPVTKLSSKWRHFHSSVLSLTGGSIHKMIRETTADYIHLINLKLSQNETVSQDRWSIYSNTDYYQSEKWIYFYSAS